MHFVRDMGIVMLVEQVTRKFPLKPNVKNSSKRPTGPDIVADALVQSEIDVAMTAKNVERIWRRYLPIMSGKFPVGYIGPFNRSY